MGLFSIWEYQSEVMRHFIFCCYFVTVFASDAKGNIFELQVARMGKVIVGHPSENILKLNMSRWRDAAQVKSKKIVLVNTPEFRLRVFDADRQLFESRVLVGRKSTPTPVFSADIIEIVVNPKWLVPKKIAVTELLPQLQQDPSELIAAGFIAMKGWGRRTQAFGLGSIDWKKYDGGHFPFRLEQRPGKKNPLGPILFVSPNPHAVFLHSTTEPALFHSEVRTLSHGCVRVEKAVELALLLLKDEPMSVRESFVRGLRSPNISELRIPLSRRVKLYSGYWTAWVDQSMTPHFLKDVYDWDAEASTSVYRFP